MKQLAIFCAAALAVLSGCISYEYDGKVSGTPTSTVEICTDASKLNMNEYSVLGTASASGDSVNYSRYELFEKLSDEAKKCGADIILVISHQVVPSSVGRADGINASFDQGDSNTSWPQIGRDMDSTYGNARGRGSNESIGSYTRVIRAKFLKRNNSAAADKK